MRFRLRWRERVRRPFWSFVLLGVNVLIFFLSLAFLSLQEGWSLREGICARQLKQFCFTPAQALALPWSFLTSAFLHADVAHLFFNMLALFFFGVYLESRIGSRKFLLLYFSTAFVGSLAYWLFDPSATIPALGASGAIFGILGALAVLYPRLMVWIGMPMPVLMAAFLWGIVSFLGMFAPATGIAHQAHLGGLLLGVAYGIFLRKTRVRPIYVEAYLR